MVGLATMVGLTHFLSMFGQILNSDKSLATQMTFNFVLWTPGFSLERRLGPVGNWRSSGGQEVRLVTAVTLGVNAVLCRL